MRSVYVFSYANHDLDRRGNGAYAVVGRAAHMMRDGHALQFLLRALAPKHRHIDTIPNYPANMFNLPIPESPELPPDSLILLATRPPLNDDPEAPKERPIYRSETKLEKQIFKSLERVIQRSTRREMALRKTLVPPESGLPLYNLFHLSKDPYIVARGLTDKAGMIVPDRTTVGYLIYQPSIAADGNGPALLACFGMAGVATIIWSLILGRATAEGDSRLDLLKIIDKNQPRLIAADFSFPKLEALPPTLGSLATQLSDDAIKVDIEGDVLLGAPARAGDQNNPPGAVMEAGAGI